MCDIVFKPGMCWPRTAPSLKTMSHTFLGIAFVREVCVCVCVCVCVRPRGHEKLVA